MSYPILDWWSCPQPGCAGICLEFLGLTRPSMGLGHQLEKEWLLVNCHWNSSTPWGYAKCFTYFTTKNVQWQVCQY